jgi:clan AA aspartic protease
MDFSADGNTTGQQQRIDAIVDTGFSSGLTLPGTLIAALGLPWINRHPGRLADGSIVFIDTYAATVLWDGQPRLIAVEAIDGEPLVGMKLLQGHVLRIEVTGGGSVTVEPIP